MTTGPDVPGVECYTPDECCAFNPCWLGKQNFIFSVRALLPPGQVFSTLLCEPVKPREPQGTGVGCFKVGCQQLVYGACCGDEPTCYDYGNYPQLAVFDSYSAGLYDAMAAVCTMLRELDPCTAESTLASWATRYGLLPIGRCDYQFTDKQLKAIVCFLYTYAQNDVPLNFAKIAEIAAAFGAEVEFTYAGDFSDCNPYPGWWTLARSGCEHENTMPMCDGSAVGNSTLVRLVTTCDDTLQLSLNVILRPIDIHIAGNCNHEAVDLPHDPELYEAFKILLERILPQTASICIYEEGESECDFVPVAIPTVSNGSQDVRLIS